MTWEMDLAIMQEDAMERGKQAGEKEMAARIAEKLRRRGDISEEEIAEITKVAGDKPAQQC